MSRISTTVGQLARDFDTFFLDVWGVLHTGEGPLPGVIEALQNLQLAGRKVILLTNTSRLGPQVAETLDAMGISRSLFADVVTAGDVTHAAIVDRDAAVFAGLPRRPRAFHYGNPEFVPWLLSLDFEWTEDPSAAEIVFATGVVGSMDALHIVQSRLRFAARSGVPLVCTNPDRVVPSGRGAKLGPGAVADAYAAEGGPIFLYGKPHPPIYDEARRRAGDAGRIIAMGDMLPTDIAGALTAGLPSALIGPPSPPEVEDGTHTPDFVLSSFAW